MPHVSLQQEDPQQVVALGLQLGTGEHVPRVASVGVARGGDGVAYSRNLLEEKKVEVSTVVVRKTTVS